MKRLLFLLASAAIAAGITACTAANQPPASNDLPVNTSSLTDAESENTTNEHEESSGQAHESENTDTTEHITAMKMNVQINGKTFTATLEDNAAARELTELMEQSPVSISMSDYAGFEKVGALVKSLTAENRQITTSAGDIVLYNGNQIVIFYGSNSWSYTKLGRIDDLSGWADALGSGDITAVFSIA